MTPEKLNPLAYQPMARTDWSRIETRYHPYCRDQAWTATRDDYAPGDPVGIGGTEADAVANLKQQTEATR